MTFSKADIKRVAALRDAAGRMEQGAMLLEGPRLVLEGLRAGAALRIFAASDWDGIAAIAAVAGAVPIETVSPSDLERMVDVRTPAGVAAVARLNRPQAADRLLAASDRVLFLECVQDPGNVGTLARTAWALGVDALVLSPGTADVTAPKTLRAAAGTTITMPYARDVEAGRLLDLAGASGHRVLVSDAHHGGDYEGVDPGSRFVLVASNEGAGTAIPFEGGRVVPVRVPLDRGESLNVGAAVAILLAAFRRRG